MKQNMMQHPASRNSYGTHSRYHYRRPSRPLFATNRKAFPKSILFAFSLVTFMGMVWLFQGLTSLAIAGGNTSQEVQSISTSQSDWSKGSVPALYQTDSLWASTRYEDGPTLEKSGCGPTCLSMVYIALTGNTDYGPKEMFLYANEAGYMSDEGAQWSLFTDGAQALGLNGEEIGYNEQAIRENLIAGHPVICSMGPGDFTTSGHLIVLTGIDEQHRLIVQDPNSPERSARGWEFDTILSQCRNLWAFSAA